MHRHSLRLVSLALVLALGSPALSLAAPSGGTASDKRAEATRVQAEMKRMQTQLSAGMADYERVSGDLEATRREIAANSARLKSLEATLTRIDSRLSGRASFLYRTRDTGTLDVLLGATSFDEFLMRFDLLSRLALDDAGLILKAKRARSEARRLRSGLKQREAKLAGLRDRTSKQRGQLEASLSKQRAYFGALSSDIAAMVKDAERAQQPKPAPVGRGGATKPRPGLAVATVEGRAGSYYVMADEPRRYRPSGVGMNTQASVYSVSDNGTGTSSGRPLNDSELTCAHKTLPLGSRVAITRGGRRIICVVTDRGPFAPPGRDLDLTLRAASLLGIDGVGNVHYEVVVPTS